MVDVFVGLVLLAPPHSHAAEILNGTAPSKCCFLVLECKQCATFLDMRFTHSYLNNTSFNRALRAQEAAVVAAAAAAGSAPALAAAAAPVPAVAGAAGGAAGAGSE